MPELSGQSIGFRLVVFGCEPSSATNERQLPFRFQPGCCQAGSDLPKQLPIGLAAVTDPFPKLSAAPAHRKLASQTVHVVMIQPRCHPARQPAHFPGGVGGHEGIAITIATHPGAKFDRGALQRESAAGMRFERPIESTQIIGDRLPQHLLEEHQTGYRFVDGCGAIVVELVGEPPILHFPAQPRVDPVSFLRGDPVLVMAPQQSGQPPVLLKDGAPGCLSGVGGENEVDTKTTDGLVEMIR